MKQNIIIKNVAAIIACIIAGYEFITLWKTITWDGSKLWGIIAFAASLSVVAITITAYLMSSRYKQKTYYVSFPLELKVDVDNLRSINNISITYGTDSLIPGSDIKTEVRKNLSRCNVCLVIISKKVSSLQKIEIQEMKKMRKHIIPIRNGSTYMPNTISGITPIVVDEDRLKDLKLEDL